MTDLDDFINTIDLVDHHCHGLLPGDLTRAEFESLITESHAPHHRSHFDAPFGLMVRTHCAELLGLQRHCSADEYLARRIELGAEQAARVLLAATGISDYLMDTGYQGSAITSVEQFATLAERPCYEIVRLEALAEEVARGSTAGTFADEFRTALDQQAAHCLGFKSIIAYRHGLDFDPEPPSEHQVVQAAGQWLAASERSGRYRLDNEVLLRFGLHACLPYRKPVQLHIGFGDSDIELHRCDPSHLTRFLRWTESSGASFTLLHCYPFIAEAGILSHVFSHVYLDVGLTVNYLGPSSERAIAQALEVAPFGKQLFSSDAFGLPELYACGAMLWRRGLAKALGSWVADGWIDERDAMTYAAWMAHGNAQHLYGLPAGVGS
jgi:predicted TIM-barrel fold metal-dependent hydrolase